MTGRSSPTVALALAFAVGAALLPANEPPSLESVLPTAGSLPRPKLLVLKDGRVLEGTIQGSFGGYSVGTATGSTIIPYDQVRTSAMSLDDAYRRMAVNFRDPTANDRVELARWCVQMGLLSPAREELLAALELEPDRGEARRLLLQVEERLKLQGVATGAVDVTRLEPLALASTSQVSREQTAEYMRQIQPLLLATCGNANCHGGKAAGEFHLRPTARGSRLDSDANLQTILQYLDTIDPAASPLVRTPLAPDGVHVGIFRGPKGEEQVARLTHWATQVVQEARATAERAPVRPSSAGGAILPAAAELPMRQSSSPTAPVPTVAVPADPASISSAPNESALQRVLDDARPDPFDPDEFNRRVHGTAAPRRSPRPTSPR